MTIKELRAQTAAAPVVELGTLAEGEAFALAGFDQLARVKFQCGAREQLIAELPCGDVTRTVRETWVQSISKNGRICTGRDGRELDGRAWPAATPVQRVTITTGESNR